MTTNTGITTTTQVNELNGASSDQASQTSIGVLITETIQLYDNGWFDEATRHLLHGLSTHTETEVRTFYYEGTFERELLKPVGRKHRRSTFMELLESVRERFSHIA